MTTRTTKSQSRLSYGIREVKARLSELLAGVRQGAEIVITDRGKPVAKLVGIEPGDLTLDERLEGLMQRGCLEPKDIRAQQALPPPLPMTDSIAQQYLQEDRER